MIAHLLRQRLRHQHVDGPGLARPEDVVRFLGAVQSQDFGGAKWSLGQRLKSGTDAGVERAFNEGRFLRTHVLRPTWHFVMPEDIRWMLELTAPHIRRLMGYQDRKHGIDATVLRHSRGLIAKALAGGHHLTRLELVAVLAAGGVKAEGVRLAHIMMNAELDGLVCSGPLKGKQQSYALLEERVAPAPRLTRDEALAELTRRFFHGHAPATLKHFVWWSNLSVKDARRGLVMVRGELTGAVADGKTEWFGVARAPAPPRTPRVFLIPEYDEALVGSKDMGVTDLPRGRGKARWTDFYLRPVVVDGARAGTWRRTAGEASVLLETNLFTRLDPAQRAALSKTARDYGAFIGAPVVLR